MSTNELRAGRRPTQIVWPDDKTMTVGEDNCIGLEMVDVPSDMSNVQWVRAEFEDGSIVIVNPRHVAMIMFAD